MQQARGGPRPEGSSMEKFLRLAPPSYKAENDPEAAELWLRELDKKFKVMRCPEGEKVNLATYMLQGQADVWWLVAVYATNCLPE